MRRKKLEETNITSNSELTIKRIDSFIAGAIVGLITGILLTCIVLFIA